MEPLASSATGFANASGWGIRQRQLGECLGEVNEAVRSIVSIFLGEEVRPTCMRPSTGANDVEVPNALEPIARSFGNGAAAADEVPDQLKADDRDARGLGVRVRS